jgi:hypothetical protein
MRLTIRDVAIHEKGEARWAQLPAKPQVKDGALVKDATGKIQYFARGHIMKGNLTRRGRSSWRLKFDAGSDPASTAPPRPCA